MIIWGTKAVYRHLGYVADFCPICVGAKPFALERIGMAGHLYYITAGEGDLAGYQLNCVDCNVLLHGEPDRYAAFAKRREPLPALIKETFPKLVEFHKNRLLLENQVRTALSSVPEDTRRSLMMEPFQLLSPKVVKYFAQTHFEMGKTFMKREIIPVLADTLARLRPTQQELQAVLTRLAQMRDPMGSRVKLADLMAELNERYAQAPAGATTFGTSDFSNPYAHEGKRARPAGRRAGGALRPHEKAGRMLKFLSWLSAGSTAILALTQLSSAKPVDAFLIGFVAFMVAVTVLMFFTSAATTRHESWGRVVGIILGVLMLTGFPIGTVVGGYILYQLIMGWEDYEPSREFAA